MSILAIENSSPVGSIAVLDGGSVVESLRFESPRGRGGGLFETLGKIGSLASVSRIVVGTGPGSYNGLRSAIAAAWGIALSRRAELAGVCSLLGFPADSYLAAGDARGGHFYFARIEGGFFAEEPALVSPEELVARAQAHGGLPLFAPAPISFLPQARQAFPEAAILGRIGGQLPAGARPPEPIYLKPPHITRPREAS
jgi:tRNA threonylcarbamoyladenosine biosynthesis protein TsaB